MFLRDALGHLHANLQTGVQTAFVCLLAYLIIRALDVWIFDFLIVHRRQRQVPAVVCDIARWLVVAIAVFFILRQMFPNLNLNILAMSSLVVGYIVGNATQDTLGNLVAGLALSTESPFSIGDWVMVNGHTGRVTEMTWRAMRLWTKMHDYVIIPNASIAREPIVNYSRPTMCHGFTVEVGTSYDVAPNKVRSVLIEVLNSVPDVLRDPPPRIRLTSYGDFSINYTVRGFVADFENLDDIQSHVMSLIWYQFKREGIVIPFPIRDVRVSRPASPAGGARRY